MASICSIGRAAGRPASCGAHCSNRIFDLCVNEPRWRVETPESYVSISNERTSFLNKHFAFDIVGKWENANCGDK